VSRAANPSVTGDCICRVEGLTKDYDGFRAVDNISFCVRRGEIFGFLGPNGAGKTTTIRMLCGLTKITKGKVIIDGHDLRKEGRIVKKLVGVVPDISNLYAELSCWDNLIFCGEMYGVPREERVRRAEELLKFFGLQRFRDTKFKNLSKGLKRRLTIAAALMHSPKILFLDEPSIGLDVLGKRKIWRIINELNKQGVTIFLTTHNIYEAFRLCHRIAVINRGKIIAVGTPNELRRMVAAQEIVEVSFSPFTPSVEDVLSIEGVVSAKVVDNALRLVVDDVITALDGIIDYARRKGLSINMLSLRGADAEEVFLSLLGGRNA